MAEERRIILPGDPGWDKPRAAEVAPPKKLPDAMLEAAFTEVVKDVQGMISEGGPVDSTPVESIPMDAAPAVVPPVQGPAGPKISYKYHNPAQKRSFDIPLPKPVMAILLEDLPRSWERKCFAGKVTYVREPGKAFSRRVGGMAFRKGNVITITGLTLFPGVGNLYAFAEGSRGSYCVRQEQIQMLISKTPTEEQQNVTPISNTPHIGS